MVEHNHAPEVHLLWIERRLRHGLSLPPVDGSFAYDRMLRVSSHLGLCFEEVLLPRKQLRREAEDALMCYGRSDVTIVTVGNGARAAIQIDGRRAYLHDIRVSPDIRRQGRGRALLALCMQVARDGGATMLIAETQNINLAACYLFRDARMEVAAVDLFAYEGIADDVVLIRWRVDFFAAVSSPKKPN